MVRGVRSASLFYCLSPEGSDLISERMQEIRCNKQESDQWDISGGRLGKILNKKFHWGSRKKSCVVSGHGKVGKCSTKVLFFQIIHFLKPFTFQTHIYLCKGKTLADASAKYETKKTP